MILQVKNTKTAFRNTTKGWESTTEFDGDPDNCIWNFTFRGESEIKKMWGNRLVEVTTVNDQDTENTEDMEIFGDTLDEPIPDDLKDILRSL